MAFTNYSLIIGGSAGISTYASQFKLKSMPTLASAHSLNFIIF